MSDNKEYMDILYKAKNLNDVNLQYLIKSKPMGCGHFWQFVAMNH